MLRPMFEANVEAKFVLVTQSDASLVTSFQRGEALGLSPRLLRSSGFLSSSTAMQARWASSRVRSPPTLPRTVLASGDAAATLAGGTAWPPGWVSVGGAPGFAEELLLDGAEVLFEQAPRSTAPINATSIDDRECANGSVPCLAWEATALTILPGVVDGLSRRLTIARCLAGR